MSTPPESITTVNGRRCTRSRARTAAISTSTSTSTSTTISATPSIVAPTEFTSPPAPAPQPQSSAAPNAPSPQSPLAAPPAASSPPTAVTSAAAAPEVPAQSSAPPAPVVAGPEPAPASSTAVQSQPTAAPPVASTVIPEPAPAPATTSTEVPPAAASQPTAVSSAAAQSPSAVIPALPALPESSTAATSIVFSSSVPLSSRVLQSIQDAQPSQTAESALLSGTDTSIAEQPQQTSAAPIARHSTGANGVIGSNNGHRSKAEAGGTNVGGFVAGILGGVAGLLLIGLIVSFCVRRRKRKQMQPKWDEKTGPGSSFADTARSMPSTAAGIFARVTGKKTGPLANPYRHTSQNSVSSVYSSASSNRSRSASESQAMYSGPPRRMSSRKSERNVLRKKNSSVSSQAMIPNILEDSQSMSIDPFADPRFSFANSGPLTPQPVANFDRGNALDPFVFPAAPPSFHSRTQSAATALNSHPPSSIYTDTDLSTMHNEIAPLAPNPTWAAHSHRPSASQYSFNASSSQYTSTTIAAQYQPDTSNLQHTFNAISTDSPRQSALSPALFGEPGPSRPTTNVFAPVPSNAFQPPPLPFSTPAPPRIPSTPVPPSRPLTTMTSLITPGLPTGRTIRQSDPFDLDRPEILNFVPPAPTPTPGPVYRELHASVGRLGRGRRSSFGGANWGPGPGPSTPFDSGSLRP